MNRKAADRRRRNFFAFLEDAGLDNLNQLASAAGIASATLYNYKHGGERPTGTQSLSRDVVEKLLVAIRHMTGRQNVTESDLFGDAVTPVTDRGAGAGSDFINAPGVKLPTRHEMPQDVPVYGTAAGSVQGAFQLETVIIDYVRRPPALAGAADAYAIYVVGESMAPWIKPGDLRFVHPHRPVQIGDVVVVQVRNGLNEPVVAYIKELARRAGGKIVLRQVNPDLEIEIDESKVVAIHKVLTLNDLFGV